MKKAIIILFVFFIVGNLYSQSGWFQQTSGTNNDLNFVLFTTTQTGWISGKNGTLLKTTNSGNNWVIQNISTTDELRNIMFPSVNVGYIIEGWIGGGNYHLQRTTDNGNTWTSLNLPTAPYYIFFVNENTGWMAETWFTCKINKTTNKGDSWINIANFDFGTNNIWSLFFYDENTGWFGGDEGRIYKSTNGGFNWVNQTSPATSASIRKIYFASPNIGWAMTTNSIIRTTNGGSYWYVENTNLGGKDFQFINNTTGYAVGSAFKKTTDGGINWTQLTSPGFLGNIFFINTQTGWTVGTNGRIYKTTTGGIPLPVAPTLIYPPNGATLDSNPTLTWQNVSGAISYNVQVSNSPSGTFQTLIDSSYNITQTQYHINCFLAPYTIYYWRVSANNEVGTGPWSTRYFNTGSMSIKTISLEIPNRYCLFQNYPNPFNPNTKIQFDVAKYDNLKITVYDLSGKELDIIVNELIKPGTYEMEWSGEKYASGIYFYRMQAENFIETRKMILMK